MLIVLLPKADGGRRPIGLFSTVIRLWMRVRSPLARAWEAAHALPCVFGGRGCAASAAAWQAAFAVEAAGLQQRDAGLVLLDLAKAFETVPQDLLVAAAARHEYPLALLRLSLAAYAAPRTVGIDGAWSRLRGATRGITAGSGFATTELRLLFWQLLLDVRGAFGAALTVQVYVDDITLGASGTPQHVVGVLARAAGHFVQHLEVKLHMDVAGAKSKVVVCLLRPVSGLHSTHPVGKIMG